MQQWSLLTVWIKILSMYQNDARYIMLHVIDSSPCLD